jgi:hypothetical protein
MCAGVRFVCRATSHGSPCSFWGKSWGKLICDYRLLIQIK